MNRLKNFLLNLGWMFKILAPFFAALVGIALMVSMLLAVLHLVTGEKVSGEVVDSYSENYTQSDGSRTTQKFFTVSYRKNDSSLTTTSISAVGLYQVGEKLPLLVSGRAVKIAYWGELFGLSMALGVVFAFLILAYWGLSKMKYEPKDWSFYGFSWMFKRQD